MTPMPSPQARVGACDATQQTNHGSTKTEFLCGDVPCFRLLWPVRRFCHGLAGEGRARVKPVRVMQKAHGTPGIDLADVLGFTIGFCFLPAALCVMAVLLLTYFEHPVR